APEPATPPPAPSRSPAAPTAKPTPGSPLRFHWSTGVAVLFALGAAASFIYYCVSYYFTGHSTGGHRQSPTPSPSLDFVPRWDPARQQIGPAGSLSDGSGLRLISRLEIGTPRLEDDRLVATTANNGGLSR